ncbi:MAG: hypothetical protein M5R36_20315 [Deltaproteobacteria bacterium]|nr:hypothetical protein [Deltaproteobacteria bacterium]
MLSDVIAILGLLGVIKLGLVGPFTFIWFLAMMLFFMQSLIAISLEEEESFKNIVLSFIMYITYCQVWIVVIFRAFWLNLLTRRKKGAVWEKTIRYKIREKEADG